MNQKMFKVVVESETRGNTPGEFPLIIQPGNKKETYRPGDYVYFCYNVNAWPHEQKKKLIDTWNVKLLLNDKDYKKDYKNFPQNPADMSARFAPGVPLHTIALMIGPVGRNEYFYGESNPFDKPSSFRYYIVLVGSQLCIASFNSITKL